MKKYNHLTIHEREQIKLWLSSGLSCRQIGRKINRSYRTIARELKRNSPALGIHTYCSSFAHKQATKRRQNCKTTRIDKSLALRSYIVRSLGKGWSPEEISGRLKKIHSQIVVCPETIYRFIYDKDHKKDRYHEFLHRGHRHRENWFDRRTKTLNRLKIPNRINISLRPKEANLRQKVGHLETDLMEGSRIYGGAVSVTVDRKSGFVMLDKLKSKQSDERIQTLIKHLEKYPRDLRKTITLDNGKENTNHELLNKLLGCQTYFCNPYHSWEKGTVENTIGLIRSWIPKGSDLSQITQVDLNAISIDLNHRPRKRLGYLSPYEVLLNDINWGTSI